MTSHLCATKGRVLYKVVNYAMERLGIRYTENDIHSILIWNDTIKTIDYFRDLAPWQVVNRLPDINYICRKAPFVRLIQRISRKYPSEFCFLPNSYILPLNNQNFVKEPARKYKKFIVKPDNGALGQGIVILEPEASLPSSSNLAVAQEYIESYLIGGYKFDLRIYALIIGSTTPEIYVYHDGIARFCSVPASCPCQFSQLTNTAVNIKNTSINVENITRMVSDVFGTLSSSGADINKLWRDIENAIALTVISACGFLVHSIPSKCRNYGYPRCFQLLGFDVLLDQNLKPWILEVNYRPSLEFGTQAERDLKVQMLSELIPIAVPFENLQDQIQSMKTNIKGDQFESFLQKNPEILNVSSRNQQESIKNSQFRKVFPSDDSDRSSWKNIYEYSCQLDHSVDALYFLPKDIFPPKSLLTSSRKAPQKIFMPQSQPRIPLDVKAKSLNPQLYKKIQISK